MVLPACATLVLGTNAALMDTDDTILTLTVPPADNMPGSFRILPSSGSSEQTSGAGYHWGDIPFVLFVDRWSRYHGCLQPVFNALSS